MLKEVLVPDIGSYSNVEIIEISVAIGDVIKADTTLITLETDKATLEVPAPFAGVVKELRVKVGDKVSEGSLILTLDVEDAVASASLVSNPILEQSAKAPVLTIKEVIVPDIGTYSNVDIIEVSVAPGDSIKADTPLITLETDKAALEVPAPFAGVIKELRVKVGDKVSQGSLILTVEVEEIISTAQVSMPSKSVSTNKMPIIPSSVPEKPWVATGGIHAGPGVRRFARELGADLTRIRGTGPKNRILKMDVQSYVKQELQRIQSGGASSGSGFSVAPLAEVDFAKFGDIVREPLSRIQKLSGSFLHRNWVTVPHVTQFDEADITELEAYRKQQQPIAQQQNIKLTPLVYIMKAVVTALQAYPKFNASLDTSGTELILKKYFHIGVAVDTPNGLVVPVVRNVDQKGILQLATELAEMSVKARDGALSAQDMQGSSFSISSLGGIGGTAFTPIINVPDVAILGVSKAEIKPIYIDGEFKPRLRLPLSLSYDHRVIDGAQGARFITFLAKQLSEFQQLIA